MKFNKQFTNLLDINRILSNTPKLENIKIILKNDNIKGTSIFATQNISKGEIIAHYKMKLFNKKTYNSPTKNIYAFTIYTINGNPSLSLVGDIDLNCIPAPINNIPFWGQFANEPSSTQDINANIDINNENNYKTRKILRQGSYIIYNLVAQRDIKPGEEITIYYGNTYQRSYDIHIKDWPE